MINVRQLAAAKGIRHAYASRQILRPAEQRLLWVEEGALGIEFLGSEGRTFIAEVLGAGSSWLFDSAGLTGNGLPRLGVVVSALVPSVVLELTIEVLAARLFKDLQDAQALFEAQADQYASLLHRLALLRVTRPVQRVAGTLAYLAARLGTGCPIADRVQVPLTQDLIAAAADLTRQTTNAALRHLYLARLIHLERGMVCIIDPERLSEVAAGGREPHRVPRPSTCRLLHPDRPFDCQPLPVPLRRNAAPPG